MKKFDALPIDQVIQGDSLSVLEQLPDESVDLVFADPPYNLQLRQDLWRPNLTRVDAVTDAWDQFPDPQAYDQFTRSWLAGCRRVLKRSGALWVIGTYHHIYRTGALLQDLGFWLLNDITWIKCLAGETRLLALIDGAAQIHSLRALSRLNLACHTVQLPSCDEEGYFTWVNLLACRKTERIAGLRLRLESGQEVECTAGHRFPIEVNGRLEMVTAGELRVGDALLKLGQFVLPVQMQPSGPEPEGELRYLQGMVTPERLNGYSAEMGQQVWMGDLCRVQVAAISPGGAKYFYDLAVDGSHLFALANGLLTHNSNPMPNFRGVRFTNAHETLLWAQKERGAPYTFNHHALKSLNDGLQMRSDWNLPGDEDADSSLMPNQWYLPICNSAERLRINGARAHSTQKPEALLYRILLASTNPGDVVLDPFFGTGTSGVAARRLRRHWLGIEREPAYVELARQRIAAEPEPAGSPSLFHTTNPRKRPRLPFGLLLENGFLRPGQQLFFQKDPGMVALVRADASLEYNGQRGSIHQLAHRLRQAPCNGWECWYYQQPQTGDLLPIDTLRHEFRRRFPDHPASGDPT